MGFKSATLETIAQLESAHWFNRVGNPMMNDTEAVSDEVIVLSCWKDAIEAHSGNNHHWQGVRIEAANNYREKLIAVDSKLILIWNEIMGLARTEAARIFNLKVDPIYKEFGLPKSFEDNVKWDIVHLIAEVEYSEYTSPSFYTALGFFYISGRFPCGWKGNYPKGNLIIY